MFEDLDQRQASPQNKLNNKLVQPENENTGDFLHSEEKQSYQEKLKDTQFSENKKNTEDIFEDTEEDASIQKNIKLPDAPPSKEGLSPTQPLKNYQELVAEGDSIQGDKIKPHYFILGLIIILILLGNFGVWAYQKLFTGERNTGNIVLNTEPEIIDLVEQEEEKIVEEGISINEPAVSNDIDGDGLSNEEEEALGTNPNDVDTDGDGLSDREEVKIYHTDPLEWDTDGDTYCDGEEVVAGYDPLGPGRLFDFSLITGENFTEEKIKSLIYPEVNILEWNDFNSEKFKFSFKYPDDWEIQEENNKIIINKDISTFIEIELRENKLELDLVDWITTQNDYPDFIQDQIYVHERISLLINSNDPDWLALSSMFIGVDDQVYNYNLFSDDNSEENFNIFQTLILSTNFK